MLTKDSLKNIPESVWDNFIKKLGFKDQLEKKHFQTIDRLINKYTFKVLLDKLISKHDKSYEDRCYKKGCMPYPNNMLSALLSYAEENGRELLEDTILETDFPTDTFFYEGFYFIYMYGQGTAIFIYDENKNLIFQI